MTTLQPLPTAVATYITALERALKPLPAEERADVLRELQSHLEDGLAAGQAPEALIAGMGPAHEVAEALMRERLVSVDQRRTPGALARIVAWAAAVPYLVTLGTTITLMVINTLYLYAELLISRRVPFGSVAFLLLYNLPAILVVNLPIGALMAGLAGLPKLATVLSAPTMRRVYPRLIAAGLLAGVLLGALGFALNDYVVPTSNRMTVDLVRVFILNEPEAYPEARRSPQERSLAEQDRRLATMRAERDARVASNAPFKEIETLDEALHSGEVDRHSKLALPAYALPLMALGLALGTLLARRRPVPVWIHVGIGFAAIAAIYTAMNVGRFATAFSGSPALAAWIPLLLPAGAAAVIWTYAVIAHKGVFADV